MSTENNNPKRPHFQSFVANRDAQRPRRRFVRPEGEQGGAPRTPRAERVEPRQVTG